MVALPVDAHAAPPFALPRSGRIEAEGLGRRFGELTAVRDVTLRVERGEVLALLGPNGAGKTTTLQMLAGLLPPTEGRAVVAGYDICSESDQVRAHVGLMVDEPGFYPEMTIDEYLFFVTQLYRLPRARASAAIDDHLERFDLTPKRRSRLDSLSKGMRQKVALIRALIHTPPVLLLDEPTSALDPLSVRTVHQFIKSRRAAGDSIIISTHNLPEAQALADRVALIARGRLRRQGTLAEMCRAPDGLETFDLRLASHLDDDVLREIRDLRGIDSAVTTEVTETHHTVSFRTGTAEETNGLLIDWLARRGCRVVTLAPRPYDLAGVYLEVIAEAHQCP
jgi:ABC-2 type transport system ATP-binding protein